jgi:uncharacterized protein (TIGR02001 family)
MTWSAEYEFDSGWYGGVWWGEHSDDNGLRGQREFDYWVGYATPLTDKIVVGFSALQYTFPDAWLNDYDWEEAIISLHVDQQWSLSTGVNRNQFGQDKKGNLIEITHRRSINSTWFEHSILDVSLGRIDNTALDSAFIYYELGISRDFGNFRPRLAWVNTNNTDAILYERNLADEEWTFSLSYSF